MSAGAAAASAGVSMGIRSSGLDGGDPWDNLKDGLIAWLIVAGSLGVLFLIGLGLNYFLG